ncbi:glycyl-tRNA synthetase [Aphelenchoides avenae]|nr:glycyl-tRNA synthetase [Aphelenchus avenae]
MVVVRKSTKHLDRQEITPAIVQLSFFVPRLMHAIVEHAFRNLGSRLMLELRPYIAPYHCLIIPKSGLHTFVTTAEKMHKSMLWKGIRSRLGTGTEMLSTLTNQADETGTPYTIVIGMQSLVRNSMRLVKLRHNLHDVTVHIELKDAVNVLADLIGNKDPDKVWSELAFRFPRVEVPEDPEVGELNEAGADSDE